jgi:23S rRNA-/tRNA-specific pseudouridylate synthase
MSFSLFSRLNRINVVNSKTLMNCRYVSLKSEIDIASMVLYEDNHLLVLNKPCGLLMQGNYYKYKCIFIH